MRTLPGLAALLAAISICTQIGRADQPWSDHPDVSQIRHVLLISIDGMHALDLQTYIANYPASTLAKLNASAVNYTNASSTKPSDSFPAMVGMVTGGSPAVTGIYYDDAYNRALFPAADTACAGTPGVRLDLKEGYDKDPNALDAGGGLDPNKLPRDAKRRCAPVYPHDLLRVNTVFEVIRAARLHTAFSEKRPAYDILNGPSGRGVVDLYAPEIAAGGNTILKSLKATKNFDDLRVASILNQIQGRNSTGTAFAPVPAIFGMNFQAINSAKKENVEPFSGYSDIFSTPSAELLDALNHTDESIGKMVTQLQKSWIYERTAIIITAKHGETPLDPLHRKLVLTTVIPGIANGVQPGLVLQATQKANALIWLKDQSKTADVVRAIEADPVNADFGQILSGASLKLLFPDPLADPATPDIIVVTNTGVNFEPSLTSTTKAEHGGFGENDTHVPLMVSIPGTRATTVQAPVQITQIAPTILELLRLDPSDLDAVRLEGTAVLPRFDRQHH